MIKNTPNDCMGNQSLWTKLGIAVRVLKNPWLLLLDKVDLIKNPIYETQTGLRVITRGGTTDINDAVVVLSGHEYPQELLDLNGSQEQIIVDCGGHIGTFTLYVRNLYPRTKIFTFEPVEANRKLFNNNMSLNNMAEVTLIPKALYGESGKYFIDLSGKQFDAVSLQSQRPNHENFIEIEAISFSQFLNNYQISFVDLLKLDVEGSEYNIFQHSMLDLTKSVKRLIMEYHPAGDKDSRDQILKHFEEYGWELIYETKNILGFKNLTINEK